MKDLWFVVPCYGRYEMTRLTLGWLAHLRNVLPYEVDAVVVALDENLTTARELGFRALEETTPQVGSKFNDGYEYVLEQGGDYVVHWQSDNLALPEFFGVSDHILSGHRAACLDAARIAYLDVRDQYNPYGAGPFVFPVSLLGPVGGRPIGDDIRNGVDQDLVRSLTAANPGTEVKYRDIDPLQLVSLKDPLSINSFADLEPLATRISDDPFGELATRYPQRLVQKVEALYASSGS